MMEAARTSETPVNFYQTTRCYNPEDSHLSKAMVCLPCIVIPFLLFIWHRYIQPIVLKFWNPWKATETKTEKTVPLRQTVDKSNEENSTCPVTTEGNKKSL